MERTDKLNLGVSDKVILIDWGLFLHRSVFAWSKTGREIPATYTCVRSILTCLKLLDLTPNDLVIVAIDGRNNWRKEVDPQYKANRKDLRDKSDIDWKDWYNKFDILVEKLKTSTPFFYIKINKLEADDIIAASCRYFKDNQCIIISSDSDFEQLYAFPNVKILSPVNKKIKEVKDPYKILANKIKQEKTDNLISEVISESDFNKRFMLVNLMKLPEFVDQAVFDALKGLEYTNFDITAIPFKSIRNIFMEIYNSKPIKKASRKETKKNVIPSSQKIF